MFEKERCVIKPYPVGQCNRSLAMVIPKKIVSALKIDHLTDILLLNVSGANEMQLKIIREEDLIK